MRLAIRKAKAGIRQGQTPFGACIVKDGKTVSCSHNTVWKSMDITAHAEVNAIRQACKKLKTVDLSGCVIYSTCEPCPMCYSAIHWARIETIVYGCSIEDAKKAGFHELPIHDRKLSQLGRDSIKIKSGLLKEECKKLFTLMKRERGKVY
jgi:guanine deaminase